MCERKDTVICTFDKGSPKISAFDIHEWIREQLRFDENEVTIQIDGPKRQVFIKLAQAHKISKSSLCRAGLGTKIVRVAH
jgi:hypothetical protein